MWFLEIKSNFHNDDNRSQVFEMLSKKVLNSYLGRNQLLQVSVDHVQFENFKFKDTGFRIHEYLFFVCKNNQIVKIVPKIFVCKFICFSKLTLGDVPEIELTLIGKLPSLFHK